MTRRLLILAIISIMTLAASSPALASEMGASYQEQIDERAISITVEQATVHVTGANGLILEVVSLTGKPVMKIKIESPAQRVELNVPKGCYILKIGKIVRKVSIR